MISYIVKYQNNPVHSYIFERNFTRIIEKGINLEGLLKSKLFYFKLKYNEENWPNEHSNPSRLIIPVNKDYFNLKDNYRSIVIPHLEKNPTTLNNKKFKI